MRTRALVIVGALVTSLVVVAPAAAATAKPGTKCTKVGTTAKAGSTKLICTKVGRSLIWKTTVVLAPKPEPTPTTPAAPKITLSPTALIAFESVTAAAKAAPIANAQLDVRKSPNATDDWVNKILDGLKLAVNLWAPQYLPTEPLPNLFFTEKDRAWFEEQLRLVQFDERDITQLLKQFDEGQSDGMTEGGASGSNGHYLNTYTRGTKARDHYGWRQVAPHEWTHMAQSIYQGKMPCWFTEGSAMYYGIALTARDTQDFQQMRTLLISDRYNGSQGAFMSTTPTGGWPAWLEANDMEYDHSKCGPNGAYPVGAMLTEYLVSLKGHAGIVDFMTGTAQSNTTWQEAMLAVYGLTHDQWLANADAYLREAQLQVGS